MEGSPLADGAFTGSIIGEAILAVLLFLVASGIMRASSGYRLFVAIVQCIAMGAAIYVLIAHHAGGYVYRGVFSLFVARPGARRHPGQAARMVGGPVAITVPSGRVRVSSRAGPSAMVQPSWWIFA